MWQRHTVFIVFLGAICAGAFTAFPFFHPLYITRTCDHLSSLEGSLHDMQHCMKSINEQGHACVCKTCTLSPQPIRSASLVFMSAVPPHATASALHVCLAQVLAVIRRSDNMSFDNVKLREHGSIPIDRGGDEGGGGGEVGGCSSNADGRGSSSASANGEVGGGGSEGGGKGEGEGEGGTEGGGDAENCKNHDVRHANGSGGVSGGVGSSVKQHSNGHRGGDQEVVGSGGVGGGDNGRLKKLPDPDPIPPPPCASGSKFSVDTFNRIVRVDFSGR